MTDIHVVLLMYEADVQSLEFGDVRRSTDVNKDSSRRPPRFAPSVCLSKCVAFVFIDLINYWQ